MTTKLTSRKDAFTLIELLVVITIIAILAGIALPVFTSVQERGNQTKALANAKQIGLACKLWATDNDGQYPNKNEEGVAIESTFSNDFFKTLIPAYCPQEKPFYTAGSAWNTRTGIIQPPDEVITDESDRLTKGENTYAYVPNLTETSNPNFPLIADGFSSSSVGIYEADKTKPGGVWKGLKAIVIRVDQSGAVEKCRSTDHKVYGQTGTTATAADIFATGATNWLSTTNRPVNPE